jgi:hypothetical protein
MCLPQASFVESKCIGLRATRDYAKGEVCRRSYFAMEHVSLIDDLMLISNRQHEPGVQVLTSGSIPCEPNRKNSNEGC